MGGVHSKGCRPFPRAPFSASGALPPLRSGQVSRSRTCSSTIEKPVSPPDGWCNAAMAYPAGSVEPVASLSKGMGLPIRFPVIPHLFQKILAWGQHSSRSMSRRRGVRHGKAVWFSLLVPQIVPPTCRYCATPLDTAWLGEFRRSATSTRNSTW